MLILTVFPSKCVSISPYLDKFLPHHSLVNSVELSQDIKISPYSTRSLIFISKDEDMHLFRKGTTFRLYKIDLDTGIYTFHVYCSHYESKYLFLLNNPKLNSITIKKGIFVYTSLDCTHQMTQTMSVIDNVAFIEFVKAFTSDLNKDLHVCSTEAYIYFSTEIHSRNKQSEMVLPQNELAMDFPNEVKSSQPRLPKMPCDIKRKPLDEKFFSGFNLFEILFLNLTSRIVKYNIFWVLVENNDVFSKFNHGVGKITQQFHV